MALEDAVSVGSGNAAGEVAGGYEFWVVEALDPGAECIDVVRASGGRGRVGEWLW